MNGFDELIGRLTRRLRVDPELQMEVSHELRTHLEDSATEFQRAGKNEVDARAEAVKALGDEGEIADKLWQANQHRIRVRKAVKWGVGVTLIPAAIAATLVIAWGALVTVAIFVTGWSQSDSLLSYVASIRQIADQTRAAKLTQLSGDPLQSEFTYRSYSAALAKAKVQAEQNPNDPVYWANYLQWAYFVDNAQLYTNPEDASPLAHFASIAKRGAELEPGNALYPMAESALLASVSTRYSPSKYPESKELTVSYRTASGRAFERSVYRRAVTNRALFDQSVTLAREAARRPFLNLHFLELCQRKIINLPSPIRFTDQLLRVEIESQFGTDFLYDNAIKVLETYAVYAAEQRREDDAIEALKDSRRLMHLFARDADGSADLNDSIYTYGESLNLELFIWHQLGKTAQADEAQKKLETFNVFPRLATANKRSRPLRQDRLIHAGMIDTQFSAWTDPTKFNLSPGRRADYAISDQLALSLFLLVLALIMVFPMLGAVVVGLRSGIWPSTVFIGWKRMAKVVFVSTVLPGVVYSIYACFTPVSGRSYGMLIVSDRIAVEYSTLAATILILLRISYDKAVRTRAAEIGLQQMEPDRLDKGRIIVGIILGVAVIAFLAIWQVRMKRVVTTPLADLNIRQIELSPTQGKGFFLATAVAVYGMSWLRRRETPFIRNLAPGAGRSMHPIIAWSGVGLVITAGSWIFASQLDRSNTPSNVLISRGVLVCLLMVALVTIQTLHRRKQKAAVASGEPAFSTLLSAVPVLLFAMLSLSLFASLPLRWLERRAVVQMNAPASGYSRLDLSEQTSMKPIRDYIVKELEK